MNLQDLLTRDDQAVSFDAGGAILKSYGPGHRRLRGIELEPGTVLRLKDAHTFYWLKDQPTDVSWKVEVGKRARVLAVRQPDGLATPLGEAEAGQNFQLKWPLWLLDSGFDLLIEALGDQPVGITIGPLLDPRAKMRPLIKGKGLELGPGLVPRISPTADIDIEYVEERHPEEWQQVYGRGIASLDQLTPEILERYRVGSALTLDDWAPSSLDFIFSNHVFEHLPNPIQVLKNWLGRIRTNGALLAVVPDTRFTFDLRQQPSTLEEMLEEERRGGYAIDDEKYRRWCEFTAPHNTVEDLKARRYSIHVHYYTPALFRRIGEHLIALGECRGVFLETSTNNKEFAVILRK